MDKIYTNWKKIIAAAFVLAIASVGAPQGAHAASWLDGMLDMPSAYGTFEATNGGLNTNKTDIYGDYELALSYFAANGSGAADHSCAVNAKSYYDSNKTNSTFAQVLKQFEYNNRDSGIYTIGWYMGLGITSGSFVSLNSGTSARLEFSGGGNWGYYINFRVENTSSSGKYMPATNRAGHYIIVNCTANVTKSGANALFRGTSATAYGSYPLFVRNITVNYPSGYVGSPVRTNYVAPVPPLTNTPSIRLRGVNNWKGEFSDENFLTFDEVPFTCEEGLAPVISGELWDDQGTPVMIDTFTANATALFNIELPEDSSDHDYRIVSWYVCDDDVNFFSDSAHYSFTITSYGTLKEADLFAACMDTDFPFIHPEACLENIFTIINLLKFNSNAQFGGNWNTPQNCYQLTYIDDWINRPDQVVCPAVKPAVRALMTPVVVFLLGLAMLRVLNRSNERSP